MSFIIRSIGISISLYKCIYTYTYKLLDFVIDGHDAFVLEAAAEVHTQRCTLTKPYLPYSTPL